MRRIFIFALLGVIASTLIPSVSASGEFLPYAEKLAEKEIISRQSSESSYRMGASITRAELAKIAANLADIEPTECSGDIFADVTLSLGDLCGYIEGLADAGIISTENLRFRPYDPVSRAELAKMLIGSVYDTSEKAGASPYEDIDDQGDLADYIDIAYEIGCTRDATTFRPRASSSRGEVFKIAECVLDDVEQGYDDWVDEIGKGGTVSGEASLSTTQAKADAAYNVSKGEVLTFVSGKDDPSYRAIWDEIRALSPDSLSDGYIERFEIVNNPNDDTLAFVDDEDGNGKWRVAINLPTHQESTPKEQKATFIHELGHIITLNASQINANTANCTTKVISEGCANTSSYYYNFWKNWWKNGKLPYTTANYVSEYASSEDAEDLAESFAYFVLKNEKEPGDSIAAQKINFFYNYGELVKIRSEMRGVLSEQVLRARKR